MTDNDVSLVGKIDVKRLVFLLDLIHSISRRSVDHHVVPDSDLSSVSRESHYFFCLLVDLDVANPI